MRWRISTTYFVAVGCLFLSAAFVSLKRHPLAQSQLRAPPSDTIGVADVLSAARRGYGDVGLAFLIFLGPVGAIFRGPVILAIVGVLLLLTAGLQSRQLRLGELVGVIWALGVVVLLMIALTRISASYSFAARVLMFGPASTLNVGLLVVLSRRSVLASAASNTNH